MTDETDRKTDDAGKRLEGLIRGEEDEHAEFKEAKSQFDFKKLLNYCIALANERGGKLVLGVTNSRPRRVVGTRAFQNIGRTKTRLYEALHMRINVEEIQHSDGRALVFHVPSRPLGTPLQHHGRYLMRAGGSLVAMSHDRLRDILDEDRGSDFSGEVCPHADLDDLSSEAVERFRVIWHRQSGNDRLQRLTAEELLSDAQLLTEDGVSYAALILLGSGKALGRYLPDAEVIFEYRPGEASVPYAQRLAYREGFLLFYDRLWDAINLRNEVQPFQDGLFVREIPTFGEPTVREGILNAVSHRDYRASGSVFIRQYPRKLEITSPGGFPEGITPENILWKQVPRNRRIAEAFEKCGFVERSGQGARKMFEECIKEGKLVPDFEGTDDYQVVLTLRGEVEDPDFLRFLEKVGRERIASFATQDFLVLDAVRRGRAVPHQLRSNAAELVAQGVIESIGKGRGARHILSSRFYRFLGKNGEYTRRRGLDRETNKQLLLEHLRRKTKEGSPLRELHQVLPSLSRYQVQGLLRELKKEGRIHSLGRTRAARWFPNSGLTHNRPKPNNAQL